MLLGFGPLWPLWPPRLAPLAPSLVRLWPPRLAPLAPWLGPFGPLAWPLWPPGLAPLAPLAPSLGPFGPLACLAPGSLDPEAKEPRGQSLTICNAIFSNF